jgi:hypothetical protein
MRSFITFIALFLTFALAVDASAFLGQRTFGFNFTQADVKDSSYDGYNATERAYNVSANFPMDENVDLSVRGRWGTVTGNQGLKESRYSYGIGALYHFAPGGTVDPYVGTSYNYASSTAQTNVMAKRTVSSGSISLRTGAEAVINNQISVIPQYTYTRYFNEDLVDQDSAQGSITAVYWASEYLAMTVTYAYDFDDSTAMFTTGASVSF